MKSYLLPGISAALLLSSCSQNQPAIPETTTGAQASNYTLPKETTHSRQYLALPGQSARPVSPTDTDDAFERQAAAYATDAAAEPQQAPGLSGTEAQQDPLPQPDNQPEPSPAGNPSGIPEPAILQNPGGQQDTAATPPAQQETAPATPSPATRQSSAPSADYAVQVTNGTVGRLFVEVQDDSGNVFPIAFMHAGQNISTPPMEAKPIAGKLTVVVRDPDQPNAPELRRYKVDPPANYSGKTVGITILPGGQYRASLDGEVYYTSPAPTPPGQ